MPRTQTSLELEIDELTRRLEKLEPQGIAAFSASSAERLSPFYDNFNRATGWGNFKFVRRLLDDLWDYLSDQTQGPSELMKGAAELEKLVPHSDDFQHICCIGAQDFAICLDSGIHWATKKPPFGTHVVQYS